jgi:hypothetical protein
MPGPYISFVALSIDAKLSHKKRLKVTWVKKLLLKKKLKKFFIQIFYQIKLSIFVTHEETNIKLILPWYFNVKAILGLSFNTRVILI